MKDEDGHKGTKLEEVVNMEPKKMSVKEFREEGYLQEVNRRVLHRAGLALEVLALDIESSTKEVNKEVEKMKKSLEETDDFNDYQKDILRQFLEFAEDGEVFGKVWDYRDDEEGMCFGDIDNTNIKKAKRVKKEMKSKDDTRTERFGFVTQPLTPHKVTDNGMEIVESDSDDYDE